MADTTELEATNILKPIRQRPIEEQPALISGEVEKVIPKIAKAEGKLEEAKESRLVESKIARADEAKKQAGITREEYQKGREKLNQYELPTFKPTQEDATSYAQLASLVGTLGVMLGAGGKASAKAAIGAMTGMMEGWKKGRKDLYERELKTFNTELSRMDKLRKDIMNDAEMSMRLRATDAKAAEDAAEAAMFKSGSGSVSKYLIETGQYKQLKAFFESQGKVVQAIRDAKNKAQERKELAAERFENQKELQRMRGENQKELERMRGERMQILAALKEIKKSEEAGKGVGDEKQKPTADITNKFDTTRDGLNSMTSVLEKLEGKVVKDNWEKGSVELRRFLAERPTSGREDTMLNQFIKQRSIQSLPAEVRELIITIAAARNDYYKAISGTAVSGNEATRNFGAIIQPSDNLEQLRSKASEVAKKQVRRINEYVDSYSFAPGLIRNAKTEVDRARKYYEATLPAGIPSGSRKIGKSPDGKDVYEAPDGEQYTPD